MFFYMRFLVVSLVAFISFGAYAGTAAQTDWSGGDGVFGPVTDWGSDFYADTEIECYLSSSNLLLQKTMFPVPLEYQVDGNFNGAWSVYSADVNGDGYMDVLGAANSDNCIIWWGNVDGSGTILTEHTVDGNFDGARSVHPVDINGDDFMDVLGASENISDITWWENIDGSGTSWTEHTVGGTYFAPFSAYSADVNGDGYMDILGASRTVAKITWWENADGSGTSWTEHTVDSTFTGAVSVHSADINGDGYIDLLGAAYLDNDITWWENEDGSGTSWTEHIVDGDFGDAHKVYSADVNGDGYMDVLGAANSGDEIVWWENMNGSGTSWTEHTVDGSFNGALSVFSSDVNGDGHLDILGAALEANDITWWDLTEYLPDGSLESSVLDVQESPVWQTLSWDCTEPTGTSVSFQVRASDNSSSMGVWSDTLTAPCTLEGILGDEDNYFQYRVILNTTDSLFSPVFHDVTIDWQLFTGTEEESEIDISNYALYGAHPNPALNDAVLVFALPVDSRAELTVYDLTGRAVHRTSGDLTAGTHEVLVNDLACGVYLIRMTSGEFTATRQFVVIE